MSCRLSVVVSCLTFVVCWCLLRGGLCVGVRCVLLIVVFGVRCVLFGVGYALCGGRCLVAVV